MVRFARTVGLAAVGLAAVAGLAAPAGATHKGEKITVSKTSGLVDGDVVKVTFSGFAPGGVDGAHPNAKIVIAGQNTFTGVPDKLNFDEYANAPQVLVQPDGTGSADYTVFADHGTVQDGTTLNCAVNKCWLIVIQEPFLGPEGEPRYATQEITFGGAPTPTSAPVVAPTTTAAPTATTAPPVVETTTTMIETTTTTVAETTTTTIADAAESDGTVTVNEDEGSSTGLIIGIAAAAVVVLGGGAFLATRKKPPVDGGDTGSGEG